MRESTRLADVDDSRQLLSIGSALRSYRVWDRCSIQRRKRRSWLGMVFISGVGDGLKAVLTSKLEPKMECMPTYSSN